MQESGPEELASPSVFAFARAIAGSWFSLMSGAIGVALSLVAPFVDAPTYKPLMYMAGALAAMGALYTVWAAERRERIKAVNMVLARRPHVVPLMVMSGRTAILCIKNVGSAPAMRVQFEPIRSRNSSARLIPIQVISPDDGEAEVNITFSGGAHNLWDLLDEKAFFEEVQDAETKWPDYGTMRRSDSGALVREVYSAHRDSINRDGKRPYRIPLRLSYEDVDGKQFVETRFCFAYMAAGPSWTRDTRSLLVEKFDIPHERQHIEDRRLSSA